MSLFEKKENTSEKKLADFRQELELKYHLDEPTIRYMARAIVRCLEQTQRPTYYRGEPLEVHSDGSIKYEGMFVVLKGKATTDLKGFAWVRHFEQLYKLVEGLNDRYHELDERCKPIRIRALEILKSPLADDGEDGVCYESDGLSIEQLFDEDILEIREQGQGCVFKCHLGDSELADWPVDWIVFKPEPLGWQLQLEAIQKKLDSMSEAEIAWAMAERTVKESATDLLKNFPFFPFLEKN